MGRGCRAAIVGHAALHSECSSIILSRGWRRGDGVLMRLLARGRLMYVRERQCACWLFFFLFLFHFIVFCSQLLCRDLFLFHRQTAGKHTQCLFINWFIQVGCKDDDLNPFKCLILFQHFRVRVCPFFVFFLKREIYMSYKYLKEKTTTFLANKSLHKSWSTKLPSA